jgi:hypothetical protein
MMLPTAFLPTFYLPSWPIVKSFGHSSMNPTLMLLPVFTVSTSLAINNPFAAISSVFDFPDKTTAFVLLLSKNDALVVVVSLSCPT